MAAKKLSKLLVVDTDIIQAAGAENATDSTAKICRDALGHILDICHRLVVSVELLNEYRQHRSGYAQRWLVGMYARKKVKKVDVGDISGLSKKILNAASDAKSARVMKKDLLLIGAAKAADKTILSMDETARTSFAETSANVSEIRKIVWVNPNREGGRRD